jgi:uncharacterized spore protein YtfJ
MHRGERDAMVGTVKRANGSRKASDMLRQARSSMSARRVYAKPVRSGSVTVIPAARVLGGAAGNGEAPGGLGQAEGAGFGVMARPVGAFVIRDGVVRWKPAIDLLPLAGIALLLLLALRSIIKLMNQP